MGKVLPIDHLDAVVASVSTMTARTGSASADSGDFVVALLDLFGRPSQRLRKLG